MSIKVNGLSNLQSRLNNMCNTEKIGEAVQKGILAIEADAKLNCAVDTGNLRASISSEMVDETTGEVGTNVEYANCVEYGTYKMPARPFLNTAYESNIENIRTEILNASIGGDTK